MPSTHVAIPGDSLCSIAYMHGLGDCLPLRNDPANAAILRREFGQPVPGDRVTIPDFTVRHEDGSTEAQHTFVRRGRLASIRFVHGSPDLPFTRDVTLNVLNISKYITNRAGAPDGSAAFPGETIRRFNADGHQDPDTFKVEVQDLRAAGNTLQIDLEALRPSYNAAGAVTGHAQFPGAIRADRELLALTVQKQNGTQCFRTSYLRLVVDAADKAAAPTQTLLTSDMHDNGDSQVEILDQIVRASYVISTCPANPQCLAIATIPIGTDRRRIRLAVHVLRNQTAATGGTPVVALADAERRVRTWFRRIYAQATIAPKLMQAVSAVDPVENLISISNDSGLTAAGDGQFGFRINAPGGVTQTIGPHAPNAGDSPFLTATRLAALVNAPFVARVSSNPARFTDPIGSRSADILITHNGGLRVTIDREVRTDSRQTLTVGRANPLSLQSWDGTNWLVGSLEQRTILKNYDTGDNRVDIFVVQATSGGNRGEAMMSGHRVDPNRSAIRAVKWSAFLAAIAMDGTDVNPFSFPHEVGHVAGEVVHAQGARNQLMTDGGTSGANAVDGTKRIRDAGVTFDTPAGSFNLISRIRAEAASLLETW